jgi:hypothetical protein
VQAILCIFGFGKETKQKRVSGKVVRLHSITDPLHQFATTKVLSHWEARPELVLGDRVGDSTEADFTDDPQ